MTSALDAFEVIQLFSATGTDTERERERERTLMHLDWNED
jgi:hypothetical protein